ncbi:YpmS family protein [Planomicrobium sp. YIM 101495]|uniref:YpmS family protein n=1 Tax=Planomicrobium sp. YIM 101495 TaxID=2665160 RepID=UPI0012B8F978|nr:YpmS family protein [Planomicrobium sp. YIM 101495]MTD29764.1 DUF2140 family protein [Planomicrobium sp. YIM 101495]
MKFWKFAFFALLALNLLAVIGVAILALTPAKDHSLESLVSSEEGEGNSVVVQTTKADFEGIANTYIEQEMADQPIPLQLSLDDDVSLSTEIQVFSLSLPIQLRFEPYVQEDGNLLLVQESVGVGLLDIPPADALKLLRDSVSLPDFMEVRPEDETVLLKLSEIPIGSGIVVRAESFDLENDDIRLRVSFR